MPKKNVGGKSKLGSLNEKLMLKLGIGIDSWKPQMLGPIGDGSNDADALADA